MAKGPRKSGVRASRNAEVIPGVNKMGRSASRANRGAWRHAKKGFTKKEEKKLAPVKSREPRFYAADDCSKPIPSRKNNHKAPRLRKSITPGTVLIVLAGRFKGKRVVFLKQLESGLLLVTGPYKVNGVPLRRLNQAYVISTSTKVNVSGVDVAKINDEFFAKAAAEKKAKDGEAFFAAGEKKKKVALPAARLAEQKRVDTALLAVIEKTDKLKAYLGARFSLTKNTFPHALKF